MKIGIVSNTVGLFMPLLLSLFNYKNKAGVILYVAKSTDAGQSYNETLGFCKAAGITLTFEERKDDLYNWQQLYSPDILFFTGYGYKVHTHALAAVQFGIYNIHFGKLPQFRGPSPVFWQLRNGVKELGICIHRMAEKLDAGDVVWQQTINNAPFFSYDYVNRLFAETQAIGVVKILDIIHSKKQLPVVKQDEFKAAYQSRPQLKDVIIDWDTMEAAEIVNIVKACDSWNKGAATILNDCEFKIIDASVIEMNENSATAGTIIIKQHNGFFVKCKGNSLLHIHYFKFNNCYAAGRFADAYGIKQGQRFTSLSNRINN